MKKRIHPLLGYALGAAALLVLVVLVVDRGPFQRGLSGSEVGFWEAAKRSSAGEEDRTLGTSLYVQVLSLLVSDTPTVVREARRTQTLLLLPLFSLAVFALTTRRAGRWWGTLAGLLAIVVGPAALDAGGFSPAMLAGVLGLGALVVLDGRPGAVAWLVGGVLLGLLAHVESTLAWSLFLLLAIGALRSPGRTRRVLAAGAVTGGALAASILIGALLGGPKIPSVNGMEIYRGHSVMAGGTCPRRSAEGDLRWWAVRDYVREASRTRHQVTSTKEAGTHFGWRGVEESVSDPAKAVKHGGVKLLASFQGDPLPRDVSAAFMADRSDSWGLRAAVWIGRIVIPLGLAGLILARKRLGMAVIVGSLSAFVAAWITYAQPETRMVTVGSLLVAAGVLASLAAQSGAGFRLRAGAVGLIAVALWGFAASRLVPGNGISGEDVFQLGSLYDREGRAAALREYEHASRLDPGNPTPRFAIAGMLARDNVVLEAILELEALRQKHPTFYPGLVALVNLYQKQQQYPEAASLYDDIIEIDPWNPEPMNNAGTVYAAMGLFDQAGRAFEGALKIDTTYAASKENLAGLRERGLAGVAAKPVSEVSTVREAQEAILQRIREWNAAGAESLLTTFREQFGERFEFDYVEGLLRLTSGDSHAAIPLFEAVQDSLARDVIFLNNLGSAYAQGGRPCDALRAWKEALRLQPANARIRQSVAQVGAYADSLKLDCGD